MKKYSYNESRKEWSTLVYDGTYNQDGSKHRKRLSSKKSSADLEKKVIAFKNEVAARGAVRLAPFTFGEYAEMWLATAKASKEQNTKKMYESVLSCFDIIDHVPLTQITHSHFQQVINEKQDHPRTCQVINITFKQIIKSAVKDHYLPRTALEDIITDISLPTYKKPEKRPLTALEKKAMEAADLEPKKRCFVSLLYYCGLRKQEALALTPSDFDWKEKTVSITKAWVNYINTPSIKPYPKSANGIRTVPIPDVAMDKIRPYVESVEGYVFKSANSDLMTESAYKRMWSSIICSMNIALGYDPQKKKDRQPKQITGLTAHIFRHNYCTELCYQVPTISTKMVARLLGDNEKMVLEVYSHIVEDRESTSLAINNIFSACNQNVIKTPEKAPK